MDQEQKDLLNASIKASGVTFRYLILDKDGRTPVVVDFVRGLEWSLQENEGNLAVRVATDEIGEMNISTVFLSTMLGRDDDLGVREPFETMVLGRGSAAGRTERYATWKEAEEGHKRVLDDILTLNTGTILKR